MTSSDKPPPNKSTPRAGLALQHYSQEKRSSEEISQPQQRLTREEQWEILNTHPFFTGHCPSCGYQFPPHVPELIHARLPDLWLD